jgi:deoxyxylulose-5-phosphate synthase
VFGDWLCDMAAADPKLAGITPAMREGSGLVRFSQEFPHRSISMSPSPSSMRSRSPPAWPAKG